MKTVRQLVSALALQFYLGETTRSATNSTIELYSLVSAQLLRAPFYVYLGFAILTRLFNLTPLLKWGTTFCGASPDRQQKHILKWKRSRIKIFRDFINFYESLIVLGIYENILVIEYDDGGQASWVSG